MSGKYNNQFVRLLLLMKYNTTQIAIRDPADRKIIRAISSMSPKMLKLGALLDTKSKYPPSAIKTNAESKMSLLNINAITSLNQTAI